MLTRTLTLVLEQAPMGHPGGGGGGGGGCQRRELEGKSIGYANRSF